MKRAHPEQSLQIAVARYLDLTLDPDRAYFTAIGHGGGGAIRGAQLKAMGLKPGVSDLLLTWRRETVSEQPLIGWIECKSETGRQSPEQRDFASRMRWLYHHYAIVRSLDELVATLREWGVPTKAKRKAAA